MPSTLWADPSIKRIDTFTTMEKQKHNKSQQLSLKKTKKHVNKTLTMEYVRIDFKDSLVLEKHFAQDVAFFWK